MKIIQWDESLTVEWLDSWEVQLPSHMLSIDLSQISYKERVFVAGLADIRIDVLDPFLQSISNQLFGDIHAIVELDV